VRLIVGKVTLWDIIAMALCGSYSVHTNRYYQFFSATRDFRCGFGLAKSRRGGGGGG